MNKGEIQIIYQPTITNKNISEKLVNFYTNKFCNNLYLHDKIEFNIIFTCSTLDINETIKELKKLNHDVTYSEQMQEQLEPISNEEL